jgi:hypothetical protein
LIFVANIVALVAALIAIFSAVGKLRRDPYIVKVIHEVVGVPMKWLPWLAACEIAGALGLLLGILWPPIGLAAAGGLVIYFLGAAISHLRVGDVKGIGPALFMMTVSAAALVTRMAV